METDSRLDQILYLIASLASQFYSESTRKWAKQTVENLEGNKVTEVTRREAEENMPDEAALFITEAQEEDDLISVFAGDERQRGLTALVIATKYRMKQYWMIFLIPVILYLLTAEFSQPISPVNIGIYFDLFGAIIVVRGLYRTPTEIDYQSMTTVATRPLGRPEDRLVSAVETFDSMFGSMLLALGFALQLLAVSGILFTSAVLLLVLIVWLGLR